MCRECFPGPATQPAPPLPHVRGFPALRVLPAGPTSTVAFIFLRVCPFGRYTQPATSSPRRRWISQLPWHFHFCPCRALRPRRSLQRPSPLRSPTVAFQIFDPVGLRVCHEAQSLHLRYGLGIALSTLSPCCYLHEPKTRFLVERLVLLARAGVSPAGSARLILAHRKSCGYQRPECSSPSSSGAHTTTHPAHHAGCAPGETHTRSRENPLRKSG